LIPLKNENTGGGIGLCLEANDLASSKLVAGREKDLDFVGALLRHKLADPEIIKERLSSSPLTEELRAICQRRLDRLNH
jgi:hypothetical protein